MDVSVKAVLTAVTHKSDSLSSKLNPWGRLCGPGSLRTLCTDLQIRGDEQLRRTPFPRARCVNWAFLWQPLHLFDGRVTGSGSLGSRSNKSTALF